MAGKFLDYTGLAYLWSKIKDYIDSHSGGVTVDSALDSTSENPVQNKVVTAALGSVTTTLYNNSTGASVGSTITFSKNPNEFDTFTFKVTGMAMVGHAAWTSATEIRGMLLWVTETPNVYSVVIIINNISGTTGKLSSLMYHNKNTNTLDSSAKLTNLTGIGTRQ